MTTRRLLPLALTLASACSAESTNMPSAPELSRNTVFARNADRKLDVCHLGDDGTRHVITVSKSAWPDHRGHGDYALELDVNRDNVTGDGIHFRRISDAVDAADAIRRANSERTMAGCRITVSVAAGEYRGSLVASSETLERFPIVIAVPDVTLRAATTGDVTIAASHALGGNDAILVVADDADGYHGDRVAVQGLRFTGASGAATGGIGVGALRVNDLALENNQFDAPLLTAVDARASRARLRANQLTGLGSSCGLCMAGPGHYDVTDNVVRDGIFVGIFVVPVAVRPIWPMGTRTPPIAIPAFVAPANVGVSATIVNNEITGHTAQVNGFGTGIRLVTFSADAPASAQSLRATLRDNLVVRNNFALSVDANTPNTTPAGTTDVHVDLSGNVLTPSCKNSALVSFARISRSVGAPPGPQAFLRNSTYTLNLNGSIPWDDVWYDHPAGMNNTLIVDGAEVGNGKQALSVAIPNRC